MRKKKIQVTMKACDCGHGIAIHRLNRNTPGRQRCWHPGCKCKDYRPVRKEL